MQAAEEASERVALGGGVPVTGLALCGWGRSGARSGKEERSSPTRRLEVNDLWS